jgi:hypothetical protein
MWWIRPDPSDIKGPALLAVDSPIEAIAVFTRTALVVLPWNDDPYPALKAAISEEGHVRMTGTFRDWPLGMEMLLDFGEASL